ncbi:MAG: HEAT repeat domain-containing protein [Nocardioidaceae bacterium]
MTLPARPAGRPSPRDLLAWLESHLGTAGAARVCADLLEADDPHDRAEELLFLGGDAGRSVLEDGTSWKPYWARVWGARGLLYVWDDAAAAVVLDRLADEHWRVAEMCLKVSALRELPCGDDAVRLSHHELPRVRAVAARAIGACGDVEHLDAVRDLLDDDEEDVRTAAARALERAEARLDV